MTTCRNYNYFHKNYLPKLYIEITTLFVTTMSNSYSFHSCMWLIFEFENKSPNHSSILLFFQFCGHDPCMHVMPTIHTHLPAMLYTLLQCHAKSFCLWIFTSCIELIILLASLLSCANCHLATETWILLHNTTKAIFCCNNVPNIYDLLLV